MSATRICSTYRGLRHPSGALDGGPFLTLLNDRFPSARAAQIYPGTSPAWVGCSKRASRVGSGADERSAAISDKAFEHIIVSLFD